MSRRIAVWVAWLSRHRYAVLIAWSALWSATHFAAFGFGWHYFQAGSRILFSGSGLNLYATHPELQIGPATLVVIAPLTIGLPHSVGESIAVLLMSLAGVGAMRMLEGLEPAHAKRGGVRILVLGLLVIPIWAEVSVRWSHPDDVLAILAALAAVALMRQRHFYLSAGALALAADFKPWAAVFIALIVAYPRSRWLGSGVLWSALVLGAWLPFYLADPQSLIATGFKIPVSSASVLHLFGVSGGTPRWCRPAQLLAGTLVATVAAARGRWPAVLLVGLCVRLLLEPGTKSYYESSLVIGTALYDWVTAASLIPILTLLMTLMVYIPTYALQTVPTLRALAALTYYCWAISYAVAHPVTGNDSTPRSVAGKGSPQSA